MKKILESLVDSIADFFIYKNISAALYIILLITLFIVVIPFIIYTEIQESGYYCEYCHSGGAHVKYQLEDEIGIYPCKKSSSSCHHIKRYWKSPRLEKTENIYLE